MSHVLDLIIAARNEHKLAIIIIPPHIAGFIHNIPICRDKRILNKRLTGLIRIVIIPHSDACSADINLARLAGSRLMSVIINQVYPCVAERASDGNRLLIVKLAIRAPPA